MTVKCNYWACLCLEFVTTWPSCSKLTMSFVNEPEITLENFGERPEFGRAFRLGLWAPRWPPLESRDNALVAGSRGLTENKIKHFQMLKTCSPLTIFLQFIFCNKLDFEVSLSLALRHMSPVIKQIKNEGRHMCRKNKLTMTVDMCLSAKTSKVSGCFYSKTQSSQV